MKQRVIDNVEQLEKASKDMLLWAGSLPVVMTVTAGSKIRSDAANARYWAGLNEYLEQMNKIIHQVEEAGYINLEARITIARELQPEHAAILFCTNAQGVHDIIKLICNVPTSTKLGTKDFQRFELIMEKTLSEIIGEIVGVMK